MSACFLKEITSLDSSSLFPRIPLGEHVEEKQRAKLTLKDF